MKEFIYSNTAYFWPMDRLVTEHYDGLQANATLIMGVANNAIFLNSSHMEILPNGNMPVKNTSFHSFTLSMWIRITNSSGSVLTLVLSRAYQLSLYYHSAEPNYLEVNLTETDVAANSSCRRRHYRLHLLPDIFFHTVFTWNGDDLLFYKNSEKRPVYQDDILDDLQCPSDLLANVSTKLVLFPGIAIDDIAVWLTALKRTNISNTFKRYSKSRTR